MAGKRDAGKIIEELKEKINTGLGDQELIHWIEQLSWNEVRAVKGTQTRVHLVD